ncbi:MAG: hypothetical protein AAF557_22580 [Pseudomonadota bacterium]
MVEVDTGPILDLNDKIRFVDSHRPSLPDGAYEVKVRHEIDAHGFSAERKLTFAVAGPRFALTPADIASSFPPASANGRFEAVLPHVILNRASLPWERTALATDSGLGDDSASPWLALLVLTEKEAAGHTKIIKAGALTKAGGSARFPELRPEVTDDAKQPVLVLDLPHGLATDILPTIGEVELLTSVRVVNDKISRAVIVSNRRCEPGERHVAHLVSLEHQYRRINGTRPNDEVRASFQHWSALGRPRVVRLVSLAQWTFHCDASPGDFMSLTSALAPGHLAMSDDGITKANAPVAAGAVPLRHRLASGAETASWYHGPLAIRPNNMTVPVPVRHAAELLRSESNTGMLDISYSAAWELGRLLALKDPKVGVPLAQWKRRIRHAEFVEAHKANHPEIVQASQDRPDFPLATWFENALARLAAVPFDYLVPEPSVLPQESIRFFALDRAWIAALTDGAFSIGRTSASEQELDRKYSAELPVISARSGVLVRSSVVDGWPDLLIDGFDSENAPLKRLRFERLGQGVLLALFAGRLARAEVHLHPQAIHFGFDGSLSAGLSKQAAPIPERPGGHRVVKICDLSLQGLAKDLNETTPHGFARTMIEGVPKVVFKTEVPDV